MLRTGEKLPPHDNEAEEAVIGSLLIDPEAIVKVSAVAEADDFHQEKNRWIYLACLSLHARAIPTDQITVADELERAGRLDAVGRDYLAHIISQVPSSVYAPHYAAIVHRLSVARRLILAAGVIAHLGYEANKTPVEMLALAYAALDSIDDTPAPKQAASANNQHGVFHD